MTNSNAINYFSPAKWVVSKIAGEGTHTTIGGAIAAASNGDTIVVMPGVYTENNTVTINLNITAFSGDSYVLGNVTIIGGFTVSSNITLNLSNLKLQTNSNNVINLSSSLAVVNLTNCYINCANNIGMSISSGIINLNQCSGITATGSNQYFSGSGGSINLNNCNFQGGATTACTLSSTGITINNSIFQDGLIITGTGLIIALNSTLGVTSSSLTPLTQGGSATSFCYNCQILTGLSSAVSVGTTLTLSLCVIGSNNINAITGAGTLIYSGLTFTGTSSKINTTTQTGGLLLGGLTQAPTAGFIGERISSGFVGPRAILNVTVTNLTSITLTAGIWDISAIAYAQATTSFSTLQIAINTTTAVFTGVNFGDNGFQVNLGTPGAVFSGVVPSYRVVISSNTTYFLNIEITSLTGTATMQGRISAVRAG